MTIGGADCAVTTASNTELECVTGPHMGSAVTVVEVEVAGNGIAEEVDNFVLHALDISKMLHGQTM